MEALRIIRRDGVSDRRTIIQRLPPGLDARLTIQNAEIADPVESVEISEDRPVHRIDEREAVAGEPWPAPQGIVRQFGLKAVKHPRQRAGFGQEAGFGRR